MIIVDLSKILAQHHADKKTQKTFHVTLTFEYDLLNFIDFRG